ncbi:hypothetical protein [Streptomyces sp. V1I6]|uniref:hypothetical protein n=1 Tax=Streptomyces sp. V1I6 TaxID=3042273 RepID=UPI002785AE27|nr:hypothetical protein [Streptomyces sp. V1I6]MDQ0847420.1 hypothetical protein [Streptomyces sp. V1I6]
MAGQPVRQRIVVPFTGHKIGEGFNSETVERVGTALNVGSVGDDPLAPGQTAVFKFQMLTSQANLEKALNIGAEIEARYALFSAGGKFSFAESSALNTTSTYIVASCKVTNALRSGSDFTPNAAAEPLVTEGDLNNFQKAFGDRFTQALHTGGEFHALVRVTSSNTEHQRQIAASLHGELNGLVTSASFAASLQTAQNDKSSHTEVSIQVHQTGGVGEEVQIPGTEADSIREHMNRFAAAAHKHAAAYQAELLTYESLALPFPPPEELEERRRVLEDCLARRQRYWSAISDLTFAQSDDARLIFEDLPEPQQIVDLQNAFRRVLNDLMAHARNVSRGTIPPEFFVAEDEPPMPRFKRRAASRFATWWARRKDPDLLQDEVFMINRIAREVIGTITIPVEEASPETMERAADRITELDLSGQNESFLPLRSIASLPDMIDAPLREFLADGSDLQELTGLEPFSRLESVRVNQAQVRDLRALTSAAGLGELHVAANNITDLSPLRALTGLQFLFIAGNRIKSLDPLRELHDLWMLSLARIDPGGKLIENPIADARALAALPRLVNPFAFSQKLRLTLFFPADAEETAASDSVPEPRFVSAGLATRIGDSHRFQYVSDDGAINEEMLVMALHEVSELSAVPAPIVLTAVHFRSMGMDAIASTRPNDPSTSLPAHDLATLFFDGQFTEDGGLGERFVEQAVGLTPHLILEFKAA